MKIGYLIDKYGLDVLHNGNLETVYIKDYKKSIFIPKGTKYRGLTSDEYLVIYTREDYQIEDTFEFKNKNYIILDIDREFDRFGSLCYCLVNLCEDDFDKDITINEYKKEDNINGIYKITKQILGTKARIKKIKEGNVMLYNQDYDIIPTHEITIKYNENAIISNGDLIVWGRRRFLIISKENYYSKNRLFIFTCHELLESENENI